jgi:hypothetical protein
MPNVMTEEEYEELKRQIEEAQGTLDRLQEQYREATGQTYHFFR